MTIPSNPWVREARAEAERVASSFFPDYYVQGDIQDASRSFVLVPRDGEGDEVVLPYRVLARLLPVIVPQTPRLVRPQREYESECSQCGAVTAYVHTDIQYTTTAPPCIRCMACQSRVTPKGLP